MRLAHLFDHLVGALLEQQTALSRPSALAVLRLITSSNLTGGLDGKLARLRALEDAIGIRRRAPIIIEEIISVGQQAAEFSEETERIDSRETVASRQRYDLRAMDVREGTWHHDKATTTIRLARLCGKRWILSSGMSRTGATMASTAKDGAAALKGFK